MPYRKNFIISFWDTYVTQKYSAGRMKDFFNVKTSGTYTNR
jgi:hypothetical protein